MLGREDGLDGCAVTPRVRVRAEAVQELLRTNGYTVSPAQMELESVSSRRRTIRKYLILFLIGLVLSIPLVLFAIIFASIECTPNAAPHARVCSRGGVYLDAA